MVSHSSDQLDERPDPEELLHRYGGYDPRLENSSEISSQIQEEEGRTENGYPHTRGSLRVYLAAAAGAGKTYAMLNEGKRRVSRGSDVVVGYVETHGRVQTQAQLEGLEILPRKSIKYRDVLLEEMDVEAILARHPHIVLIDELAHTNVAGSQHVKRYQDILEILAAGISVVTTLNIQHLESLNDLVASITGVQVRETLPDWLLDQADEVELIDISPAALRQRMRHGNIYPPDRIEAALSHFFREGNLTALRELALRRTADKTEEQLQQYMTEHHIDQQWPAAERVLVGFDARPHTRHVIREAWRLAHGLHAELLAVSIQPDGYHAFVGNLFNLLKYGSGTAKQREAEQQHLEEHVLFAEDLGATVIRTQSKDIAFTLAELVKERQVTQIVLGQPARSRWEELIRGSITNRLLRLNTNVAIHLVPDRQK